VCTNPHKHTAKIEKHKRDYRFQAEENKYRGKEASWKMGQNRNVIGLSRDRSDVYSKKLDIIGKGRQLQQESEKEYAVLGSTVRASEGGTSTTAGRNDYLKLLAKTAQIENKIDNVLGRQSASAMQGIDRKYQNQVVKNRQKLGLPGQYGPAVFERQQSPWERIQPVVSAVSSVTGIATGMGWQPFG
tara:strand:- start:403 stop:963 length:561 start_codon:yes stop_codon:yes gene_type:complete